jgi:hypothetical protein
MGRRGMHIGFWLKSDKEITGKNYMCEGRIILRWVLEKRDGTVWTGFIWLRIGTCGGLL